MKKYRKRNFLDNVQPVLKMGRSKFDLSYSIKTSLNVGDLIPIGIQEILPGDTIKDNLTFVCRATSPFIRPVMDNLLVDVYSFFVPNRLVWEHWPELMGENKSGYWKQTSSFEVPQVKLPKEADSGPAIAPDTVASYFGINIGDGIPVGSTETPASISDLPFRAFALIWNEWFRDENFQAPVYINTGDYLTTPMLNNSAWGPSNFHGKVPKVSKLRDYFTSCLPEPQKGNAVDIPIADAPVIAKSNQDNTNKLNLVGHDGVLKFKMWDDDDDEWKNISGDQRSFLFGVGNNYNNMQIGYGKQVMLDPPVPTVFFEELDERMVSPYNLVALNSGLGNINDLRFAFQLQKMLEKDARGGTRYVEFLAEHFGVISPDARLQRPEFLGGRRTPLQLQEVAQTSSSTETSPLAQLSAYSASVGTEGYVKGFVEHGFVITVACIRYHHTYQQGIERFWMRKGRYDFFDPVFANIGEQPVYRYEIYADSLTEDQKKTVFGYNEAWADLRFRPNRITGALNSTSGANLDVWHFGDVYENAPTLNGSFIEETNVPVDRTLSVASSSVPNFIMDVFHKCIASRVMPLYSIPGFVDHH